MKTNAIIVAGCISVHILLVLTGISESWWVSRRRRRRSYRRPPPPQEPNCVVSQWTNWSTCSAVCERGQQTRSRTITLYPTAGCIRPVLSQTQDCGQVNNGCQRHCNPSNGNCYCDPGYQLLDAKSCGDVNECQSNGGRGPCSQRCVNNPGSYSCTCDPGYTMASDQRTCNPKSCGNVPLSDCLTPTYTDHVGKACLKMNVNCPNGDTFQAKCTFICPANYAIAKIPNTALPFAKIFTYAVFDNVITTTSCDVGSNGQVDWSSKNIFKDYYCRRRNDAPTNIELSNANLQEHSAPGTIVANITASDLQPNTVFTYAVQQSAGFYFFRAQGDKLINTWKPDWRNLQGLPVVDYHIILRATDNGNPAMWLDKNFTITVTNVNDPPQDIKISNNTVADTSPNGTLVGLLSAVDRDGPRYDVRTSDFKWELIDGDGGKFILNNAELLVAGALNHDTHRFHRIVVKVTDKDSNNPKSATTTIFINVMDTNDVPKDLRLIMPPLYENSPIGHMAGQLIATDQDGDHISFDISNSDVITKETFSLGNPTCENKTVRVFYSKCTANLTLQGDLDYENRSSYPLKASAIDSGGGSFSRDFVIHVVDVNEAPNKASLSSDHVAENSPAGTVIGLLSVTDPDTSQGSQIHICNVVPDGNGNTPPFSVQGLNLKVSKSDVLDYENVTSYIVNVTCSDTGNPPLSISTSFKIKVKNVNEPPEYIRLTGTVIREDAHKGTVIGQLLSHDPDHGQTQPSFHIVNPVHGPLTVGGTQSDQLVNQAYLDYETMSQIDVIVRATDQGGLSIERAFTIKVLNVNEAPTDVTLSSPTVSENTPDGTLVSPIIVTDPDRNSTESCQIVAGNSDYFRILSSTSGLALISSQRKIDYEYLGSDKKLYIRLKCSDQFGLSLEKGFYISVEDINEPPTGLDINLTPVPENVIGAEVGQITVHDPDANQRHTCQVVFNGTKSSLFEIDSSLVLKTKKALNFERHRTHHVVITCTDVASRNQRNFTTFKDIVIQVIDVNELPISPCKDDIFVDEAASNGTLVHTFLSHDPDNEEYELQKSRGLPVHQRKQGVYQLLIKNDKELPFILYENQYLIKRGVLNRQRKSSYTFQMNVSDDGTLLKPNGDGYVLYKGNSLSVNYTCHAYILASTDPKLGTDIMLSSNTIVENSPNGTKIGSLSISNGEPGETYSFSLVYYTDVPFKIVGKDVVLVAKRPLDYETNQSIGIAVAAYNSKGRTVQQLFMIRIINVNEKPTDMCLIGNKIQEHQFAGTAIGRIIVNDPDYPKTSQLCQSQTGALLTQQDYLCRIDKVTSSSVTNLFYVDSALVLRSNATFDYAKQQRYLVHIVCEDRNNGLFAVSRTFPIDIKYSHCAAGRNLVEGICVCAHGYTGPKCDRDPNVCKNTICAQTEVCVSHIKAEKRCITQKNQVPVLLRMPYSTVGKGSNLFKLENYVEAIFEGRAAGMSLSNILQVSSNGRRRRAILNDIYVEAAKLADMKSVYTFVILVGMDPSSKYSAIAGDKLCPLFKGTDIRCLNQEDCKILEEAEINFKCPYTFTSAKGGNTGKNEAGASKPQAWHYGIGAGAVIAIAIIVLVLLALRRRRKSKAEESVRFSASDGNLNSSTFGQSNPMYGYSVDTPEVTPGPVPRMGAVGDNRLVGNLQKKNHIQLLDNQLYEPSDKKREVHNPMYSVTHPAHSGARNIPIQNPVYESIGPTKGKRISDILEKDDLKEQDVVNLPDGEDKDFDLQKKLKDIENDYEVDISSKEDPRYQEIDSKYFKPDNRKKAEVEQKGKKPNK